MPETPGRAWSNCRRSHSYLEPHIEQGPILEAENIRIGAVENLQGISWQRLTIRGNANHAGTTPIDTAPTVYAALVDASGRAVRERQAAWLRAGVWPGHRAPHAIKCRKNGSVILLSADLFELSMVQESFPFTHY